MEHESTLKLFSANKCSWLLCAGIECIGTGVDDNGKIYLEFPYSQKIQDILNRYYKPQSSNELAVFQFIREYWNVRQMMKQA